LFTQSEFVPYSTPKTRPSFVPNASTGVACPARSPGRGA
jgi:hypothetical protein